MQRYLKMNTERAKTSKAAGLHNSEIYPKFRIDQTTWEWEEEGATGRPRESPRRKIGRFTTSGYPSGRLTPGQ